MVASAEPPSFGVPTFPVPSVRPPMAGVVRRWDVVPASTPLPLVSSASVCHCPSLRAAEVNAATSDGGLAIVVLT